tara:strand:+ start:3027 stop:3731 length:705 start_codon:yes stop_codon:yes gene_type:complete
MYKIQYGNTTISYEIIKSNRRKTSEIIINKNGVCVRIPNTQSIQEAKKIVAQKAQWIFKKQLYYENLKPETPKEKFTPDSLLSFRGKNYLIKIKQSKKELVKLSGKFLEFHILEKKSTKKQIKEMYQKWLEQKAESHLDKQIEKFSSIVGVKPKKIIIKNLKGRWGSTTEKSEINLNANIMKAPNLVIDYIVLHEICHLKIKEHSFHFWNLVSKYMPKYREQIKWLEINGIQIT